MITIYCNCGEKYHADEEQVGKKLVCNRCQRILVIGEKKQIDEHNYHPIVNQQKVNVPNNPYTSVNIQEDRISKDLFKRIFKYAIIFVLLLIVVLIWNLGTNRTRTSQPKTISSKDYDEAYSTIPSKPSLPAEKPVVPRQLNNPLKEAYKSTPKKQRKTINRDLEESIPKNPKSLPIGSEPYGEGIKSGQSKLTVENGTDTDAIIRLIRSDGFLIRNFYIKANSSFTALELPASSCIMKVAFGVDWNPSVRQFNYRKSFSKSEQFELAENHWTETTTDGYIEHTQASQMSITLHKVPHGNFHTYPIDEKEFWK